MTPLVVIVGETGSGKSALALALAEHFNGEIISADSWAVYKEFDVGTAKPTVAETTRVPHYLIDVTDPTDGFSAVTFQRLAKEAMATIIAKGKLPILAGGTGLYVDSVIFDYGFLPPTDPALRAELNALSLPDVLARAEQLRLDMTDIDTRNKRRVIRLIENSGARPTKQALRQHTLLLGVQSNRDELAERVRKRVDAMLRDGLEIEVRQLAERYGWEIEAMKGVGYWQWKAYFEGEQSYDDTVTKIVKATMDLAKRQRTWHKRNKSIHWLTSKDKTYEAVELVATFLNNLH